jgi:hypothetical protein
VRFGRTVEDGFLPVFSVDTEEEAKRLITLACPRDLSGQFYARELSEHQTLGNLQKFSDKLAKCYELLKGRR